MGNMGDGSVIPNTTPIHIMALDGIVTVNSLFTLALFLGVVNADPTSPNYTLVNSTLATSSCSAPSYMAEDLIVFHVYSFSSFLFSSIVASALKQAIQTTTTTGTGGYEGDNEVVNARALTVVHVHTKRLRMALMGCAIGSVFGCVFLMLALVNLVQIKLGIFSCHGFYTLAACIPLMVLVPLALFLYICIVLHAFAS